MRTSRRHALLWMIVGALMAWIIGLPVHAQPVLEPHERLPAVTPVTQNPTPVPGTDRGRAAQIALCEQAGGLPVVLAGIVNSRGIGCAKPLGTE